MQKLSFIEEHVNSPERYRINDEDDLSPLEDFYSLKNAAENDQDAQYFLGMFKRNEHTSPKTARNPLNDIKSKFVDGSSSTSSYWNSLDRVLNDDDDASSELNTNVDSRKRIIKSSYASSSKKWFKSRNKS